MTVENEDWARRLGGAVQIGMVDCRILERTEKESRYYRCWEPRHRAARCIGPDRHDLCRRCGRSGHMARSCEEKEAYCPLCRDKGHSAGGGKCLQG